jgi:hypothetical protein
LPGRFVFKSGGYGVLKLDIPCVTEDRELQEKFPGIAISMDGFLKPESTDVVREAKERYQKRKG